MVAYLDSLTIAYIGFDVEFEVIVLEIVFKWPNSPMLALRHHGPFMSRLITITHGLIFSTYADPKMVWK